MNEIKRILVVGLGLMGGSYALALRNKGYEVGAIDTDEATLRYALEQGLIDSGKTEPEQAYVSRFQLVVFALYPHTLLRWIETYQSYFAPGTVLTDVTGVKTDVIYPVQKLLRSDVEFIGAHPMAGREKSGVQSANTAMFEGANYIVTPTPQNTPEAIALCEDLGRTLGFARISHLSPEEHDEMIGFLSQLAHCIAVSLMNCTDAERMAPYTGDSFRDLTRIARINDEMWSELFLMNRTKLLEQMDRFSTQFAHLRQAIEDGDREALREQMRHSTAHRVLFDKGENQ